jgi:hypothetical protein
MHRNSLCIILVDINQTLTCPVMATSPWDMKCNTHGTCEYMMPADCTHMSQRRWYHCSCKTRCLEKHMWQISWKLNVCRHMLHNDSILSSRGKRYFSSP